MKLATTALLVTAVSLPILALAAGGQSERESLRGIKRIKVEVSITQMRPEAGEVVSESSRTTVELRLRQSGVVVVDDAQASDGFATLRIRVGLAPARDDALVAYLVQSELRQLVSLARDREIIVRAQTWAALAVGYAGAGQVDSIGRAVEGQSDKFVNDYLAANPKK